MKNAKSKHPGIQHNPAGRNLTPNTSKPPSPTFKKTYKQANKKFCESKESLIKSQELAHLGSWEWDIPTDTISWSLELYRIYDIDPQTRLNYDKLMEMVHPDDRDYYNKIVSNWIKNHKGGSFEYRILRPDGSIRFLYGEGEISFDNKGNPIRMFGIVQDITERKRAEEELTGYRHHLEELVDERTAEQKAINASLEKEVAERKQAEKRLQDVGVKLQTIIDSIPSYIFIKDKENQLVRVNESFARSLGIPKEKLIGASIFDLFPKELAQGYWEDDLEVIRSGIPKLNIIEEGKRVQGGFGWFSTDKVPYKDAEGNIVGIIALATDITESKLAQEKLLAHASFLSNCQRINRVISSATDIEKMMNDVLEEMLAIFNCDRAWFLFPCDPDAPSWKVPMEKTRPEYPGLFAKGQEMHMAPDAARVFKLALKTKGPISFGPKSGRKIPTAQEFHMKSQIIMAIYPKIGKPWLIGMHQCSYAREWTDEEMKLFEEIGLRVTDSLSSLLFLQDLRTSEEEYRAILQTSQDGFWTIDNKGNFLDVNDAYCRLIGYSRDELLKMNIKDVEAVESPEETEKHIQKVMRVGWAKFESQHKKKNGALLNIEITTTYLAAYGGRFFVFLRDITERKQAEAALKNTHEQLERLVEERTDELKQTYSQLLHAEKLSALGKLAASIAHEFNNPIYGIKMSLEYISENKNLNEKENKSLNMALRECTRISNLITNLQDFYRPSTAQATSVNINLMIEEVLQICEKRLKVNNIKLVRDFAENVPKVSVVVDQIKQVFLNIISNAEEAMVPAFGYLIIKTRVLDNKIQIIFKDNGPGITDENLGKIFDPFFTTKGDVKGSGLGLSVSYGIIKKHGGNISVESIPDKGTTFTIELPII